MKKDTKLIIWIAIAHFVLMIIFTVISFVLIMAEFDGKGGGFNFLPEGIKIAVFFTTFAIGRFSLVMLQIMGSPMNWVAPYLIILFPGILYYIPLILNSFLWSFVIVKSFRWFKK